MLDWDEHIKYTVYTLIKIKDIRNSSLNSWRHFLGGDKHCGLVLSPLNYIIQGNDLEKNNLLLLINLFFLIFQIFISDVPLHPFLLDVFGRTRKSHHQSSSARSMSANKILYIEQLVDFYTQNISWKNFDIHLLYISLSSVTECIRVWNFCICV